jgi:hypothetical protein
MSIQNLANIAIGILLLGYIITKQLTWQPVQIARMWRMPAILAVIGVIILAQSKSGPITTFDIGVLLVELVISLAVGGVMGMIATFRPLSDAAKKTLAGGRRGVVADFETRTGWLGVVLWVVLIAVRIGIDVWAASAGSVLITSVGMILLMVAANRVARVALFASRVNKYEQVTL